MGLTADAAETWGYLRVYPCDDQVPEASSVNYGPIEAVAGSAYVGTSGGAICVYTSARARVIVDLQGRFGSGGASFVAANPSRVLDTRNGIGGWSPIHGADQVVDLAAAPPGVVATTGSLTVVGSAVGWMGDGPSVWVGRPERVRTSTPRRAVRGERGDRTRRRGWPVVPVGIDGDPHAVRRDRLVDQHLVVRR